MDGRNLKLDPRSAEYKWLNGGIVNGEPKTISPIDHCYYYSSDYPTFSKITGTCGIFRARYYVPSNCTGPYMNGTTGTYIQTYLATKTLTGSVKGTSTRIYGYGTGQQTVYQNCHDGAGGGPYGAENSFSFALRDHRTPCGHHGYMQPSDWLLAPRGEGIAHSETTYQSDYGAQINFEFYKINIAIDMVEEDACVVTFSENRGKSTLVLGGSRVSTNTLPEVNVCYYLIGDDGHRIASVTNPLKTRPTKIRITGLHKNTRYKLRCHLEGLVDYIPTSTDQERINEEYHPYVDNTDVQNYNHLYIAPQDSCIEPTEFDQKYDSDYGIMTKAYDCIATKYFTTTAASTGGSGNAEATGTTIKCWPTWSAPGADSVSVSVSCGGQTKYPGSSGSLCYFTGLTRGTTYTIYISGTAQYHSTSIDENGEPHTIYWSRSWSNTITITTYRISLKLIDRSTQALKFSSEITHGADRSKTIKYSIKGGSTTKNGTVKGTKIQNQLPHGTNYELSAWIDNMRDERGQLDTLEKIDTSTKLFTLVNTSHNEHMHVIETSWQAKGDGVDYDQDNILGTPVQFVMSDCYNTPSRLDGVLSHAGTRKGNTSGSYKDLVSADLDYFTIYIITCTVTDGLNIISTTITVQTLFPFCRVFHDGKWWKAMPWVYTEDGWIPAPAFIKIYENEWMESNAE